MAKTQSNGSPNQAVARKRWGEAPDKQSVIIEASCALFERDGIASTSVTQIAREVGITRELFYYYFSNKDAVVDRILDAYVDRVSEEIHEKFPGGPVDDSEAIVAVVEVMRGFLCEGEDMRPSPQREVIRESNKSMRFIAGLAERIAGYMANSEVLRDNDFEPPVILVEFCLLGVFGLFDMHPDLEPHALSRQFKEFVPKAIELAQDS